MNEPQENLSDKALRLETAVADTAAADPFPGPLKQAFLDGPVKVGAFSVRKLVPADWKFFAKYKSPFLKMINELQKEEKLREDVSWTDEDEYMAIWQFLHAPREVEQALADGPEKFRQMAVEEIGYSDQIGPVKDLLVASVMEQVRRHMLTKIHYAAQAQEGDLHEFFDSLPKPAIQPK